MPDPFALLGFLMTLVWTSGHDREIFDVSIDNITDNIFPSSLQTLYGPCL